MADEFDLFARVLGSLIVSFFALLACWTTLVGLGHADAAVWMPDLMKSIAGALVGIVGGFGIAKKGVTAPPDRSL